MAQVLKEEIYDRILQAGIQVFYEKDYRSAKMKDIAAKAGIPVSLTYSYFKNKAELFEKIVTSISIDVDRIAKEEEESSGLPSEKYKEKAEGHILDLLEKHEIFVILMDKSRGTRFENAKEELIQSIGRHIKKELGKKRDVPCHEMLTHVLASNFTESLLEVARHYKNRELAYEMLGLVTKCYYEGVNSL